MLKTVESETSDGPKEKTWWGLPPSPRDPYVGPWQKQEKWVVYLLLFWIVLSTATTSIGFFSDDPTIKAIFKGPTQEGIIRAITLQIPFIIFVWSLMGLVVDRLGVNVVYTRKFGHILSIFVLPMFFTPEVLSKSEMYAHWYQALTWNAIMVFLIPYSLMVQPLRSRFPPLYYCLRSFDRPEDRPYTLIWMTTQFLVIALLFIPMTQYFAANGMWTLYLIAAFANGLGDGLAEPIGKVFGKKHYEVSALFTNRRYKRTYIGSACVAFFTAMGILLNYPILSLQELVLLLIILPPLITFLEAKAPHTWDNVFLYGACWLVIYLVVIVEYT